MKSVAIVSTLLAAALLAGCVTDDADVPEGEDGVGTTDLTGSDGKSDSATEIRARIEGLTVWVDPVMTRDGDGRWTLEGRASRNLDSVFSSVPDDAYGNAEVTGKRTFSVTFDGASETNTMLSGLPIFITVTPTTGAPATAAVWFEPRFTGISGTSKIWIGSSIEPVSVGGALVYRGQATTGAGWTGLTATSAGGVGPAVGASDARHFRLDWTYDAMAQVANPAHDKLHLGVHDADGHTASKTAGVVPAVQTLGLTREDPSQAWPRLCDGEVEACLEGLPHGVSDTGSCGRYREVQSCGGVPGAPPPSATTMVGDFRAFLVGWYASHGADVTGSGGNSLAAAQAAVSAGALERVTDPGEDPEGHDLPYTYVFRHPDVTFPGSDRAWFLAYDKASGALLEIYVFN